MQLASIRPKTIPVAFPPVYMPIFPQNCCWVIDLYKKLFKMSLSPKPTASPAAPLPTGISSLADLMKKRHIIADIYTKCTRFYSMLLKRASGNRDIPPHIYRDLESSHSSLVLWGQGYGVADGNLDEALKKSKLLQSITLEPLIRISETLRNRIFFTSADYFVYRANLPFSNRTSSSVGFWYT